MSTIDKLLQDIASMHRRHGDLKAQFEAFHKRCKELVTIQSHPMRPAPFPASVGDLAPEGHFDVVFAGAATRVELVYEPLPDDFARSAVRCTELHPVTRKPLGTTFEFKTSTVGMAELTLENGFTVEKALSHAEDSAFLFAALLRATRTTRPFVQ